MFLVGLAKFSQQERLSLLGAQKHSTPLTSSRASRGLPLVNALRKFNTVRLKTFKMELEEGWEESIRVFETSYRELGNKAWVTGASNLWSPVMLTSRRLGFL